MRGLCVDYVGEEGLVRAVDRVSFEVGRGELLGIAGESGCGKSTVAQALLRVLPPPALISGGQVLFEGRDLLRLDEPALRALRWRRLSMVFQGALDALNPVLTVGAQLRDTLEAHGVRGARARQRAAELLALVGLLPAHLASWPHQLSGGMRQRVGIALALALEPALVVLDEPTTALDVVVEREILQVLLDLKARLGFSAIFITHDLARMLQLCDRVAIFYAGRLVEVAPAAALRAGPRHPYTQGLLAAYPSLQGDDQERPAIPGAPPSLRSPPPGCRFHPRCALAVERCRSEEPALRSLGAGSGVACHLA
ncbi:MAG: ABC transporter ATP-binding protein [Anaeromyxobacter sp.]|nr:ABC transporter ATP-binding protein [Anaeromyxobacter sp.]